MSFKQPHPSPQGLKYDRAQRQNSIAQLLFVSAAEPLKTALSLGGEQKYQLPARLRGAGEKEGNNMKARTVILFVMARLMVFAITASAAVMSYLPLAYLAYEERGYFAIGGEVLGALIVTVVVGWAANVVMKDWFRGMLKLVGEEKKRGIK